ncbi:unnamed protein product, partial [Mesorhabditis belari]|uniref:Uncharacterized protein n=1 Tax=Mesorhabditis belari TaxID=2138241 RepID=A0AAF3FNI2_9BILA
MQKRIPGNGTKEKMEWTVQSKIDFENYKTFNFRRSPPPSTRACSLCSTFSIFSSREIPNGNVNENERKKWRKFGKRFAVSIVSQVKIALSTEEKNIDLRSQEHGRGAATTVKDWFSKAWSSVSKAAGKVWGGVKKGFSWVWTKVKDFWNWLSRKCGNAVPFFKTVLFTAIPEQELPPPAYPAGFRPVHFDSDERSMSEELSFKELPPVQQTNPRLPPIPPPRPITPSLKVTEAQDEEKEENEHESKKSLPSSPPPIPIETYNIENKTKTPAPNVPSKPPMHVEFHEETTKAYQGNDGAAARISYIQQPNIDLSQYTTRIGGIGPSRSEATNETTTNIRTTREGSIGPAIEGGFYSQRTYGDGKTPVAEERKSATSPVGGNVKGAVPMLPVSVLEQMAASVETFGERTERKSATVTERVREANSKTPVPFEGRKTPVSFERRVESQETKVKRESSMPPQVVSRIENSTNDEPQFIFRAKAPASFNQENNFDLNGYLMGHSVYRPIPEAERMRNTINRRDTFHLGGANVNSRIRGWPPPSNTTPMDISKDYWLNGDSTMSCYDRNGDLVTTKLKRISEKTTEDNWKWRDHNGRVVDEKSERSWQGDLDGDDQ